jgi:hypothetical protein
MFADWSVAMSAADDDPIVVIPWNNDASSSSYTDLRTHSPSDIPEAAAHPALAALLVEWNQPSQPWHTLKCDAFPLPPEKLAELNYELDLTDIESSNGFASYVDIALNNSDVVFNDLDAFTSFTLHEVILRALVAAAEPISHPLAAAEFILRRCILANQNREGFCISIYITGLGSSETEAYSEWQSAVIALVQPLSSAARAALPPAS